MALMLIKRLLIVDGEPLYRKGMRDALQHAPHVRVVGEAGNVHQALRAAAHYRPHIVVVSESLPGISGITLVETLSSHERECISIVIADALTPGALVAARRAGAAAVIRRSIKASDIPLAINRAVATAAGPPAAGSSQGHP